MQRAAKRATHKHGTRRRRSPDFLRLAPRRDGGSDWSAASSASGSRAAYGLSVLGIGYATPYLEIYRPEAVRVLAFMPAEQGRRELPAAGRSASALVDTTAIPLPDSCIDRVLLVHALEITEHPRDLLAEVCVFLTPGGRVIAVAPSRAGLWRGSIRRPSATASPIPAASCVT